jgi:hypothetical protein
MHFFAVNAIGPPPRLNERGYDAMDLDFTGGRRGNRGMTFPADNADKCGWGAQTNPGIWFYRRQPREQSAQCTTTMGFDSP